MTDALSLAGRLAQLDDDTLSAVIAERIAGRARIDDFFDLAEALLEPPALQRALAAMDRDALAVLAAVAAQPRQDLTGLAARIAALADPDVPGEEGEPAGLRPGLAPEVLPATLRLLEGALLVETDDGRVATYPQVRDRLTAWPAEGLPDAADLVRALEPMPSTAEPEAAAAERDSLAAEGAFAVVSATAQLLAELEREPARELQKGGLSLPDARRLSAGLSMAQQRLPILLHIAEQAELIGREGNLWLPTAGAARWLMMSTVRRWTVLTRAWLDAQPRDIATLLRTRTRSPWGDTLGDWLDWWYPAAPPEFGARVDGLTRSAEMLGVTVHGIPSPAGTALLRHGAERAAAGLAAHFPGEVDRVYLQHDLSIVAPGPLRPEIDTRLRRLAEVESRTLASSYRVSAASLTRAIAAGETADSLRAFLTTISLTGIPQPLDYLIADATARFGRVRVRAVSDRPQHSTISATDESLLGTIEVDQSLSAVSPVRDGARLLSRLPRDIVYWALVDAGYPVAAEDDDGRIQNVVARRVATARREDDERPADTIVRRLRAAPDLAQNSQAWLARQLDGAVRSHATLQVSVAMPDGREVDYVLEPTGLGGGRLRARDRASDIERTLPLTSIRSVRTI